MNSATTTTPAASAAATTTSSTSLSSSSAPPPLDFATLLSREYRPAGVSLFSLKDRPLIPHQQRLKGGSGNNNNDNDSIDGTNSNNNDNSNNNSTTKKDKTHHHHSSYFSNQGQTVSELPKKSKEDIDEETVRLVLQLVSKTPAYIKHLHQDDEGNKGVDDDADDLLIQSYPKQQRNEIKFHPSFHQVELSDWESKIQWKGYKDGSDPGEETYNNNNNSNHRQRKISTESPNAFNPESILQKRRNPFLENLDFGEMISWSGSKEDLASKANKLPLLLELGVAGQSIARHVLPSHRPIPCIKSDEYQRRMQLEWNTGDITSTAELSKGSLHADKEKLERLIKVRQEKRRQMAKDKTSRVTEAMGTLNVLGSGRGRTITSSLMGPGGTERTGRPSRHVGANASHDTEYVEQLDMVMNHSLVRDLGKVSLRQYHRPRIPLSIVRTSLIWQCGIRYLPSNKKGTQPTAGTGDNASSYQAMMMGTHAGAVSKAKLRAEADLSPTEGQLILIEYSEESLPIQLTKGMATKIVTYYRGDKTRCPVSAGGGDRPLRRKRAGDGRNDTKEAGVGINKLGKPPRLLGPNHALTSSVTDWVGNPPLKTKDDRASERETIDILPEGVTEILHPKVHGPFIGEIEDGQSVTGLVSNLFVAPMVRHEPEQTDFLMILGRSSGNSIPGRHEVLNVVLRELPTSVFAAGQVEPRARVHAPNTQGEKNFIGPFVSYQIARALTRSEDRDGHGLRFDEIEERVLPNLGLAANNLRQRLKYVANYDKNSSIWSTKNIGYEDYPGVEALGKEIQAEGVAAWEMSCAAVRRLSDLGIQQLFSGSHAVSSVGVTMIYFTGQVNATKELARKMEKLCVVSRSNRSISQLQINYYEEAKAELETISKAMRRRHEVAKFIYEELQLAPWHVTGEFIDVHKKGEGTGMMKLTGLGDPSGVGEGYSFIREQDTKPSKSVVAGMKQSAEMKKITGTEDDLRKLTMKQMAKILLSYGMAQKQVNTLKRWDRVHVIRDLSTKAASDGIGDGLERFARGEKLKLSEQKQMYRARIQEIWKRQLAALTSDALDGRAGDGGGDAGDIGDDTGGRGDVAKKNDDPDKDESGSEYDDDDYAADLEEEMMDRPEANVLVAAQARDAGGGGGEVSLNQLRNAAQDKDFSNDARELAALKRRNEEERLTREGLAAIAPTEHGRPMPVLNRKIIRKKIIKTHPDGRQTISFKFIVHPEEVGKVMARLAQQDTSDRMRFRDRSEYPQDERQIGHSIFEDEDDYELSHRSRGSMRRRGRGGRGGGRGGSMARAIPGFGKLKHKMSTADRMKKRHRDDDDYEVYETMARRKGTSNRKERGSIRERRPHVIMADRLEAIRSLVEARPASGPFHKPVNRRQWPQYYEKISNPIDLATIRDKVQKYEYRTADAFLKDFELMKSNAIKFNGPGASISEEAATIYDQVRENIESSRAELSHLEEAVDEQLNTKPKKRRKGSSPKGGGGGGGGSLLGSGSSGGGVLGHGTDTMDIDLNLDEMSDSDSD